jgi:hypothetical protein
MKKIFSLLILTIITHSLLAQAGRIRISFAGFDCYRETWDDILHSDGKGDEVFFTFAFTQADRNGNTKMSYDKRTGVYGDATGPFRNRISAGSWVDVFGNNRGGIKAGDNFRCNDLIGEYDLADGDVLTIVPIGWEHDPIADNSQGTMSVIKGMYNAINQKVAPIMIGFNVLTGNIAGVVMNSASLGLSSIKAGGDQGELGKAGTRPIGMQKYGDFSPKLVALNTPNLSTIVNSNFGFGNGIIAVNYDEVEAGNLRDHGIYSILLKVEYFPAAPTPTPAPAPAPAPANNAAGKKLDYRKPVLASTTTSMPGTWKGTYGNGSNNSPSFYSFKLNADGTMQVLDVNNVVIASGTYVFGNNQLSCTYKYNNGSTFSAAATLSGSQLDGTWGSGNSANGGGRWIMSKAGASSTGNLR